MPVVVDFLLAGFTDSSGEPLNGGKVYTYEAGTSTPKATYTDHLAATPETNPVILDSNGRKQIYGRGAYKLVIKTSADVTLYTFDNIFFEPTYVVTEAELIAQNSAGKDIVIRDSITLTGNLTITAPIRFEAGGEIVTNGNTLTLSSRLTAGPVQIFDSANGEVVFTNGSVCDHMFMEWFGATGNGSTDDTATVQRTILAARFGNDQGNIPIQAINNKTYMINSVYLNAWTVIRGSPVRKSAANFKSNTASSTMFVVDGGARYSDFIFLDGLNLNANSLASKIISVTSGGNFHIRNCYFYGGAGSATATCIYLGANAIWNWIEKCVFIGNYVYGVRVAGASANHNSIQHCHFSGTATGAIYTDSTWSGDNLNCFDVAFEVAGTANAVDLDRDPAFVPQPSVKANFLSCRWDCGCTNAHLKISQYVRAVNVIACSMVDTVVYNIDTDARHTHVQDCMLGNASSGFSVRFNTNASDGLYGLNFGSGVTDVSTAGTNHVFRKTSKGDTSSRPVPTSKEYGHVYLDTTLDADGKPIFWNGTAWVDATGATV